MKSESHKLNPQMSLEVLPPHILEFVFAFVGKRELIDLCCVSKHLYPIAAWGLYKKILVSNDEWLCYYYDNEPLWPWHCWTLFSTYNFELFVDTLKANRFLASMVENIRVAGTKKVFLLPEVLSYTQLKSFYCKEVLQIPREALNRTESLSCLMPSACVNKPNVTELKLFQLSNGYGLDLLDDVLETMHDSGSYSKLRKLSFKFLPSDKKSYHKILSDKSLYWNRFILFFVYECRLNLTSLSIEGRFLDSHNVWRVQKLRQGMNLEVLETFEVTFVEINTPSVAETGNFSIEFLAEIAPYLKALKSLGLRFKSSEFIQQPGVDRLIELLSGEFRGKLSTLDVEFEPDQYFDIEGLRETIATAQPTLKSLSLFSTDFFYNVADDSTWTLIYNRRILGAAFNPQTFSCERQPPFQASWYGQCVKKHMQDIREMLEFDEIMLRASQDLPLLTRYHKDGIDIDVKRNGIIVNSDVIPMN